MNAGLVIGGVVLLIIVVFVILYFTVPSIKRIFMSEGDSCKPTKDEKIDNGDKYVLDEEKACVIDECDTNYELVSGECLSITREGKLCTPSTTETIDKGVAYEFDSVGGCFATACESGYTLDNNVCELDRTFTEMEHFIGGPTPDLDNTDTFIIFLSDYDQYDTNTVTFGSNNETYSNIFDDTFFTAYYIENNILKGTVPNEINYVGFYTDGTAGNFVNNVSHTLGNTDGPIGFFRFKVERAQIEGHDDLYYIKTDDPLRKLNGQNIYTSIDDTRPADKYIGFQNDQFEYVDSKDDASLFRLKTRSSGLSLPTNITLDDSVDSKTYLIRVVEDDETTS